MTLTGAWGGGDSSSSPMGTKYQCRYHPNEGNCAVEGARRMKLVVSGPWNNGARRKGPGPWKLADFRAHYTP
jgi:hypothetical protein